MRMVVTFKNGVQIKADVDEFTTSHAPGELRKINWTATEQPNVKINWLDLHEVVAVHAEYGREE